MNAPSREPRELLDALHAIGDAIEGLETELYRCRLERDRLRGELRATGWRPPAPAAQEGMA